MAHGSGKRIDIVAPHSPFYQGPFGRLCPELPAWTPPVPPDDADDFYLDIARNHMIERPGMDPADWLESGLLGPLPSRSFVRIHWTSC